jgi:hypothetical protein
LPVVKSQSQNYPAALTFTEELQDFPDEIDESIQGMIAQGEIWLMARNLFSLLNVFVQRPDVRPFDWLMALDLQEIFLQKKEFLPELHPVMGFEDDCGAAIKGILGDEFVAPFLFVLS